MFLNNNYNSKSLQGMTNEFFLLKKTMRGRLSYTSYGLWCGKQDRKRNTL